MMDIDLGTMAQLVTAVVAAGFGLIKAVAALVRAFRKGS